LKSWDVWSEITGGCLIWDGTSQTCDFARSDVSNSWPRCLIWRNRTAETSDLACTWEKMQTGVRPGGTCAKQNTKVSDKMCVFLCEHCLNAFTRYVTNAYACFVRIHAHVHSVRMFIFSHAHVCSITLLCKECWCSSWVVTLADEGARKISETTGNHDTCDKSKKSGGRVDLPKYLTK